MLKKWCLLSVVFAICVLLTGCGEEKLPNLGMTVDEFVEAYNEQVKTDTNLKIDRGMFQQAGDVHKRTSTDHKNGYGQKNYNWLTYICKMDRLDTSLMLFVDDDTKKIFWVKINSYHVNGFTVGDILKVYAAALNAVGEKNIEKHLADELKIENLKKYNGQNKFFNFVGRNALSCAFSFRYNATANQDYAGVNIYSKGSDLDTVLRKEIQKNPLQGIVPNPEAGGHTISLQQQPTPAQQNRAMTNLPATKPQQAQAATPKPKMKKTIPGTKPINGFWEGNPKYPLIAMNNTMTKIADKESAKFRKDGNDEVVTIDVYGFTKKDGQCWQETFTYRRKGGPTVRFSSIAQPDPFPMENAHDQAVEEAYKIACEAVGVPLIRQRDTTTF